MFLKKKIVLQTPVTFFLAFTGTFTGSTKGYDQFYSNKIEVTELRQLYAEDTQESPVEEKVTVYPQLITFKHSNQCELYGSWNHWKESAQLTYNKDSDLYHTTVYLEPGEYEYKFREKKEWILDKDKPHNGNNHVLKVKAIKEPKKIYRTMEAMRKSLSKLTS